MLFALIKRPCLIWPSIQASLQSSISAKKHFKESHYAEGVANAYKHCLWNVLLAHYTRFWVHTPQKRLAWAKKITDLHEKCFPNQEASTNMDLANNLLGQKIYLKFHTKIDHLEAWESIVLKHKNEFITLT